MTNGSPTTPVYQHKNKLHSGGAPAQLLQIHLSLSILSTATTATAPSQTLTIIAAPVTMAILTCATLVSAEGSFAEVMITG